MFDKLNFSKLFVMVALLPVILILGLETYSAYINFNKLKDLKEEKVNIKFTTLITDLLTNMGKESGTSAILISSKGTYKNKNGKSIVDIYKNKIINTNISINEIITFLEESKIKNKEKFLTKLKSIKAAMEETRMNILKYINDNNTKDIIKIYKETFSKYNKYTKDIIENLVFDLTNEFKNTKEYIVLDGFFIKQIDLWGIYRGTMSYFIAAGKVIPEEIYNNISELDIKITREPILPLLGMKDKILSIFKSRKKEFEEFRNIYFNIDGILKSYYYSMEDNPEFYGYPVTVGEMWDILTKVIKPLNESVKIINENLIKSLNKKEIDILNTLKLNITMLIISILTLLGLFLIYRNFNKNTKKLEELIKDLQFIIEDEKLATEKIELSTNEGIKKAFDLIKEVIEELIESKKVAEESTKAKSLFLANMSHEIRTPLNGILGFLELLKSTELTEEQEEYVETVAKSANNLLQIVNNILDVSKIESNKISLEIIDFNIDEIESNLEIFSTSCAAKEIEYVVYVDPEIPRKIEGDVLKIKEIFTNLVNNAVKFTEDEGTIFVSIKKGEYNEEKQQLELVCEVSDTGIGMTPSQKEKIFSPFSQADISVARKYGGTGLGLTIVKSYIELMGGNISVESELNKGTTFYFNIFVGVKNLTPRYKRNEYNNLIFAELKTKTFSKRKEITEKYLDYLGINLVPFNNKQDLEVIKTREKISSVIVFFKETNLTKIKELNDVENILTISSYSKKDEIEVAMPNSDNIWDPVYMSKIINYIKKLESEETDKTSERKQKKRKLTLSGKKYPLYLLIAEDNPINQKLLKTTLDQLGIKSEIAQNGLEAYNMYIENSDKYDGILMDVQMPILDGTEATKEILEFEKENNIPHTPIIAVTANALVGDREKFLGIGMDDYISKPIKKEELLKILDKIVRGEYGNELKSDYALEEIEENQETDNTQNNTEDKAKIEENDETKTKDEVEEKEINFDFEEIEEVNEYLIAKSKKIKEEFKDKAILLDSNEKMTKELKNKNEPIVYLEDKVTTNIDKAIKFLKKINPKVKIILLTEEPEKFNSLKNIEIKKI